MTFVSKQFYTNFKVYIYITILDNFITKSLLLTIVSRVCNICPLGSCNRCNSPYGRDSSHSYILITSTNSMTCKHAKIVTVLKASNEFWPIAFLPYISKTCESIIAKQMRHSFIQRRKPLHSIKTK